MYFEEIEIEKIITTGDNPRKDFDDDGIAELVKSIKEYGVLEPLIVRKVGSKQFLVAGERRLKAAKLAGLKKVPVVLRDLSDQEAKEIMLLENLQRQDLNPLEEAEALNVLVEGTTQKKLGEKLGKSQAWVANRLRLLQAPDELKEMVISREISQKHAVALLPYTKYAVFEEAILPDIKGRIERGETPSVTKIRDIIEETIACDWLEDCVIRITGDYTDIFADCPENCKDTYTEKEKEEVFSDFTPETFCLNRFCWKDKWNRAQQKKKKAARKRVKEGCIDTSGLRYSFDYYSLGSTWDISECTTCDNHNKDIHGNSLCLDTVCYEKKKRAWVRAENKKKRDVEKKAIEFLDTKLAGLSLGENELRYIIHIFGDISKGLSLWKGKEIDAQEIPWALLRLAVFRQLDWSFDDITHARINKILKEIKKGGV